MRVKILIKIFLLIFLCPGCKKNALPETTKNGLPEVTTTAVSSITYTSAVCSGTVITEGTSRVINKGVCWSTEKTPTVLDSKTLYEFGLNEFTCVLSGLSPETEYHVRAFATNSEGTGYGNEIDFTSGKRVYTAKQTYTINSNYKIFHISVVNYVSGAQSEVVYQYSEKKVRILKTANSSFTFEDYFLSNDRADSIFYGSIKADGSETVNRITYCTYDSNGYILKEENKPGNYSVIYTWTAGNLTNKIIRDGGGSVGGGMPSYTYYNLISKLNPSFLGKPSTNLVQTYRFNYMVDPQCAGTLNYSYVLSQDGLVKEVETTSCGRSIDLTLYEYVFI